MSNSTATVETLTAEVRVLMVGSRQVTLSVYGQLDHAPFDEMEPFGRVRPRDSQLDYIYLVGRHRQTDALVQAVVPGGPHSIDREFGWPEYSRQIEQARSEVFHLKHEIERLAGFEDDNHQK